MPICCYCGNDMGNLDDILDSVAKIPFGETIFFKTKCCEKEFAATNNSGRYDIRGVEPLSSGASTKIRIIGAI